jgi:hypothetical protein
MSKRIIFLKLGQKICRIPLVRGESRHAEGETRTLSHSQMSFKSCENITEVLFKEMTNLLKVSLCLSMYGAF